MGESNPASTETTSPDEVSSALRALVELFEKVKWPGRYRRYVLECVEGELVFRQPEIDAALEAAIAELPDSRREVIMGRRIIKLR